MARPAGLEPATHSLEGCCSIQLSYERGRQQKYRTSAHFSFLLLRRPRKEQNVILQPKVKRHQK